MKTGRTLVPVALGIAALLALCAGCAGAGAANAQAPGGAGAAAGAAAEPAAARSGQGARPSLVVVVTVDQMRADYLDRDSARFVGGFRRLARGGALFSDAQHDHANTETAPGHATILSGRYPRSTGIASNSFGVLDSDFPVLGGGASGASPRRFQGTELYDWMVARDRRSRALSVSMKDRAAILPIGRAKQSVFWYAPDGRFTTSRYYADTLPEWVRAFDARGLARAAAGRSWTLLLPDSAYAEPDSVRLEAGGTDFLFPHTLPADSATAASLIRATPWMDDLTLDFALDGVRAMRLGAGPATDLLAISLSATDVIGHRYGPDSRESHDQLLRLDRALGRFLDSLYAIRDSTRVVVALTADHGVAHFPELFRSPSGATGRWVDLAPALDVARRWLAAHGADSTRIDLDGGALWADRAALARVSEDSLAAVFIGAARAIPGVARADRPADLARADTVRDAIARRWLHAIPAGAPVLAVVTLDRGNVLGLPGGAAMHGSPWDYDSHVPLILYGPPFRPGRYTAPARVVDLAPTLARVLGVRPMEKVDGRVLTEALR